MLLVCARRENDGVQSGAGAGLADVLNDRRADAGAIDDEVLGIAGQGWMFGQIDDGFGDVFVRSMQRDALEIAHGAVEFVTLEDGDGCVVLGLAEVDSDEEIGRAHV